MGIYAKKVAKQAQGLFQGVVMPFRFNRGYKLESVHYYSRK